MKTICPTVLGVALLAGACAPPAAVPPRPALGQASPLDVPDGQPRALTPDDPVSGSVIAGLGMAIDPARPFLEIEFDHVGPRAPFYESESPYGVWLRIHNNSPYWVHFEYEERLVEWEGRATMEKGLVHEVRPSAWLPPNEAPAPQRQPFPKGYESSQRYPKRLSLRPIKDLLFDVPVEHVQEGTFIRIEAHPAFGIDEGKSPHVFVEFNRWQLPDEARHEIDRFVETTRGAP